MSPLGTDSPHTATATPEGHWQYPKIKICFLISPFYVFFFTPLPIVTARKRRSRHREQRGNHRRISGTQRSALLTCPQLVRFAVCCIFQFHLFFFFMPSPSPPLSLSLSLVMPFSLRGLSPSLRLQTHLLGILQRLVLPQHPLYLFDSFFFLPSISVFTRYFSPLLFLSRVTSFMLLSRLSAVCRTDSSNCGRFRSPKGKPRPSTTVYVVVFALVRSVARKHCRRLFVCEAGTVRLRFRWTNALCP